MAKCPRTEHRKTPLLPIDRGIYATVLPAHVSETAHPSAENTPVSTPRRGFHEGLQKVHVNITNDQKYTPDKGTAHYIAHHVGLTITDTTPVRSEYQKAKTASLPTLSSPQYRDYLKTIIGDAIKETLSLYSGSAPFSKTVFDLCTASLKKFKHAMCDDTTDELGEILKNFFKQISLTLLDRQNIASQKTKLIIECFNVIKEDQSKGFGALLSCKKNPRSIKKICEYLSTEYLVPSTLLSSTWNIFSDLDQESQKYQSITLVRKFLPQLEDDQYFDTKEFQQKCFLEIFKKSFFEVKNKTPKYQKNIIFRLDDAGDDAKENTPPKTHTAKELLVATKFIHRQTELAQEELSADHTMRKYCIVTDDPNGLTTVHMLHKSGSLASKLPSLDKYTDISKDLKKVIKVYSDKTLSMAIFDMLKGVDITSKIYNTQTLDHDTISFLSKISYLLFSTEVGRTPSAVIVNAMFIDLVQNGYKSLKDITELPVAQPKVMAALRALNTLSGNYTYDRALHRTASVANDSVHETLKKTNDIVFPWLRMKGLQVQYPLSTEPTAIKQIVDTIEAAVTDWFGLEIHRSTYSLDACATDVVMSGIAATLEEVELA